MQEGLVVLQGTAMIGFAVLGGISTCLSLWVIPILQLAPPRTKVAGFLLTIDQGARYLQTSSRLLGLSMAMLFGLTIATSEKGWDSQCTLYAVGFALMVFVAVYEVYAIFPFNDRIKELGGLMDRNPDSANETTEKELAMLLRQWGNRNWGRAGSAVGAGVVLALARHL